MRRDGPGDPPPPDPAETPADRRRVDRERLAAHRGHATWGERLVPLGRFRAAVARAGQTLSPPERRAARERLLAAPADGVPVEGPFRRIAVCGGVYNNAPALAAFLAAAREAGAEALYCLGDFGGFGPHPDEVFPLLERGGVRAIQGNYEESLAAGRGDCNCGYTDPRDNHFARISYQYTERHTAETHKRWMGTLPHRRRVAVGEHELLLVHGSPRRVNEFLFASTTPDPYLERLLEGERADGLLCTHTGLPWSRRLPSGRVAANVGVLGRPANDGDPAVRWALVTAGDDGLSVTVERLPYDTAPLVSAMRAERLPEEFVETITGGWWTTCLEILPARERRASRF